MNIAKGRGEVGAEGGGAEIGSFNNISDHV